MPRLARPTPLTIALLIGFLLVTVLMQLGVISNLDTATLTWIGPSRSPALINIMIFFTVMADGAIEVPFAFAVMFLLWRLRRWDDAKRLFLAGVSGELLYALLKQLIHRPRPDVIPHFGDAGWYSYPSGHAMLAPIIWSFALLLIRRSVTHPVLRALLLTLAIVLPLGIAISRVYLGVHYPSDVAGGVLLGCGWMLLWGRVPSRSGGRSFSSE